MKLIVEEDTLVEIEEKIIDLADEIVERRTLLKDGCTCNLSLPAMRRIDLSGGSSYAVQQRCDDRFAVCETRKAKALAEGGTAEKLEAIATA